MGPPRIGEAEGREGGERYGSVLPTGQSCEVTLEMEGTQSLALSSVRLFHQLNGEGRGGGRHHSLISFHGNIAYFLLPVCEGRARARTSCSTNTVSYCVGGLVLCLGTGDAWN